MRDTLIPKSFESARANWTKWHDVFEHPGGLRTNPVLADEAKFDAFCKEYSVGRTIRAGTRPAFRRKLIELLPGAVADSSGRGIDALDQSLMSDFGTCEGTRSLRSALSKAAAFVKPERFVAWDKFARKGLNIVRHRPPSAGFLGYAEYLTAFDSAWKGQPGQDIRNYADQYAKSAVEREERFLRRVLDKYLMKRGGLPAFSTDALPRG